MKYSIGLLGFLLSFPADVFSEEYVVTGSSMEATLTHGQVVQVQLPTRIDRNDLVIFRRLDRIYIKRVVGVPGDDLDKLQVVGDSLFTLSNGDVLRSRPLPQDSVLVSHGGDLTLLRVEPRKGVQRLIPVPNVIPADCYWVKADSPQSSQDSRRWGFIHKSQILAVVPNVPFKPYWTLPRPTAAD